MPPLPDPVHYVTPGRLPARCRLTRNRPRGEWRRITQVATAVRGALIERLDRGLLERLEAIGDRWGLSRAESLQLIQDVQLALFPEAFDEPFEGLVPDRLPHRISPEAFERFADLLTRSPAPLPSAAARS